MKGSTVRRSLFAAGLAASVGFAAGSAAAKPAIPSPFTTPPCASPEEVLADLENPTGLYVNAGASCPATCHKAEKDCEQYVKLAVTCERNNVQDELSYMKAGCVATTNGAGRKVCFESVGADARQSRSLLVQDQANDIVLCHSWETSCKASCP